MGNRLASFVRRAINENDGSMTIEAVIWIPFFFAFLVFVADVSFVFFGQAQAYRILQDANRNLSIGRLETEEEVETYIDNALAKLSPNATVNSVISNGTITSSAVIPTTDLIPVGFIPGISNINIFIKSSHMVEY